MKKKVWSLLLALALCLSLLPAAAFAEDGDSESGGETASVASVTIGSETTEYSDIIAAFESVAYNNISATITLLDNVYLREDAQHASDATHLKTCALCLYNPHGAGVYENCVYDTYYGADETGHKKACVCHRTEDGAELTAHTPKYIPNADGKTHGYRCTDCGFVSGATAIDHSYENGVCSACGYACPHGDIDAEIGSATEGVCRVCGKRIYVARLVADEGKTVEYAETVAEALTRYKTAVPS